MKLEDFLVMIGLKLLVKGYLENTLLYTTPFKNSENYVMTQALIYLRINSKSFTKEWKTRARANIRLGEHVN